MFNLDNIATKNDEKTGPYRLTVIGPRVSGRTNFLT